MIQMGNMQEKLTAHKDEHVKTSHQFEETIDQLKKETLWKIKDCEDIIKTRISEQKVTDSLALLDRKFQLSLRDVDAKLLERNINSYTEVSQRIDQLSMVSEDRYKDLKNIQHIQGDEINTFTKKKDFEKL